MTKKITWLILIIVLIGLGIYLKSYYPGSQFQLKTSLKSVSATPIEHFFNATEKSCGIWYESYDQENLTNSGQKNDAVKNCFQSAFEKCEFRNILMVKDEGLTQKGTISYSLIRVVKANDQNECIIQTYFEEYDVNQSMEDQIPLNYINTCTVLDDNLIESCRPAYIDELRKSLEQASDTVTNESIDLQVEVETNVQ